MRIFFTLLLLISPSFLHAGKDDPNIKSEAKAISVKMRSEKYVSLKDFKMPPRPFSSTLETIQEGEELAVPSAPKTRRFTPGFVPLETIKEDEALETSASTSSTSHFNPTDPSHYAGDQDEPEEPPYFEAYDCVHSSPFSLSDKNDIPLVFRDSELFQENDDVADLKSILKQVQTPQDQEFHSSLLTSLNIAEDQIQKIQDVCPECRDGKDDENSVDCILVAQLLNHLKAEHRTDVLIAKITRNKSLSQPSQFLEIKKNILRLDPVDAYHAMMNLVNPFNFKPPTLESSGKSRPKNAWSTRYINAFRSVYFKFLTED